MLTELYEVHVCNSNHYEQQSLQIKNQLYLANDYFISNNTLSLLSLMNISPGST